MTAEYVFLNHVIMGASSLYECIEELNNSGRSIELWNIAGMINKRSCLLSVYEPGGELSHFILFQGVGSDYVPVSLISYEVACTSSLRDGFLFPDK